VLLHRQHKLSCRIAAAAAADLQGWQLNLLQALSQVTAAAAALNKLLL
jgi:hypothetical protein